ncbi:putative DNA polymerase sliding clamp 2 [Paramecium bursaria Chlorella virus NE-JV-1]|nr:putative DNA polymerase sliding clamp 2 [Paramecium bursaria Chlorella virus NE-JV-1]
MDLITDKMASMSLGFKVTVESPDVLKKMFMLLDELNDDVNLVFTDRGLRIQSMDTSHVALISVRISKDFFASYNVYETIAIGIKLSSLVRVLGIVEGSFSFEYSDETQDEFVIRSDHEHFRLKTIDLESEEMEVPDMEYEVEIDADASVMSKHFKNLASFGDSTIFSTDGGSVEMRASGDIGTASIKIHDQRVKINGKVTGKFASRYLVTFAKAASISKEVGIKFSADRPIVMRYEFGPESFISFFLAPKIFEDEEDDESPE